MSEPSNAERFSFRLALALVALHVVDDNFLQPQPGTSAGDHLVSGLVPLALLAAAALVHRRLRAGARAALAMFLGLLAVAAGMAEAGYYTMTVGPSGDDYTGLVTIPAGLAMVVLGVIVLWTSRKRDALVKRSLRRAALGILGLLLLYEVVSPIGLAYLATHMQSSTVPAAELGGRYRDVTFKTSDGVRLVGWYVPSRNGAAVIVFAGRTHTQKHASMLARHGYGVLLFDRRGEGQSYGDGNMFGWGGERDILAAIAFLQDQPDVEPERIGGIGFSVGGELMLEAAAKSHALRAVVSEGAGTRSFPEQLEELHGPQHWLDYPLYAIQTLAVAVLSNRLPPTKLTDLVPRISPRPVLFIWAPNGGNAETMNPTYRRLAGRHASAWKMEGARHIHGITAQPRAYERRVTAFFDKALLGSAASTGSSR
jgi:hypothetical protein